ncbi:MAG: hypothetical protein WD468_01110, partial [Pirellulales bacterium]
MTLALLTPTVILLTTAWLAPEAMIHDRASGVVGAAKACWTWTRTEGGFVGTLAAADDAGAEGDQNHYITSPGDDPSSPHLPATPAQVDENAGAGATDAADALPLAPGGEESPDRPMKVADETPSDAQPYESAAEQCVVVPSAPEPSDADARDAEPSVLVPSVAESDDDAENRSPLADLWASAVEPVGRFSAKWLEQPWQRAVSRVESMVAAHRDRSAPGAALPITDASAHAATHWQGCDYLPLPSGEQDSVAALSTAPFPPEPDDVVETVGDDEFDGPSNTETGVTSAPTRIALLGVARMLERLGRAALDCSDMLHGLAEE